MATFPPEARDFEDRFRKHLPRSSDLTLVVLKGHLLMEEQIDGLISDLLPNPDALALARPNLFFRLRLARALLSPGTLRELLDAAESSSTRGDWRSPAAPRTMGMRPPSRRGAGGPPVGETVAVAVMVFLAGKSLEP
jgi:hypothetical protein